MANPKGRKPRNWVVLFTEKEGTTVQMHLLDRIPGVAVAMAKRREGVGLSVEPFERHNLAGMPRRNALRIREAVLGPGPVDNDELKALYEPHARMGYHPLRSDAARGFKMRTTAPWSAEDFSHPTRKAWRRALAELQRIDNLVQLALLARRHRVVVFVAVRQDHFRWALSKYHGDGTGRPGHLQFKVRAGEVDPRRLDPIRVDPGRLRRILGQCARIDARKALIGRCLQRVGVEVHPLLYEEFLEDRTEHFRKFCRAIGVGASRQQIEEAVRADTGYRKVHSADISKWVANHEEIESEFGGTRWRWPLAPGRA